MTNRLSQMIAPLALIGVALLLSGCRMTFTVPPRYDAENRLYLPPWKWEQVVGLYEDNQNIDVVRRNLQDLHWYRSEINEAVYRLQNEYAVPPEEDYGLGALPTYDELRGPARLGKATEEQGSSF